MTNWIPDTNRFSLAHPPEWWLDKLHDFDNSLVVIPSRQECVYRLAQHRKLSIPEHVAQEAMFNQSDTKMLASYSLIPVTTIIANPCWSDEMFVTLAARAPWRMGGADKVNQLLDEQDTEDARTVRAENDAITTDLSKDAWKLYLKKIGLRSQLWSPTTARKAESTAPTAPAIIVGATR